MGPTLQLLCLLHDLSSHKRYGRHWSAPAALHCCLLFQLDWAKGGLERAKLWKHPRPSLLHAAFSLAAGKKSRRSYPFSRAEEDFKMKNQIKLPRSMNTVVKYFLPPNRIKFSGPNVFSYDPGWLISRGWIIPTRASFLHSWTLVGMEAVVVSVTTLLAYYKCPSLPSSNGRTLAGSVSCLPLPEVLSESLTLITIASFMMGLFSTNVLHRWWSTRCHVAAVVGACKNFSILLTAWTCRASDPDDGTRGAGVAQQRARALRLLKLAHSVLYYAARKRTSRNDLHSLVASGACAPEEADALAGLAEPFLAVLGWIACITDDLHRTHGAITETQARGRAPCARAHVHSRSRPLVGSAPRTGLRTGPRPSVRQSLRAPSFQPP